MFRRRGRGVEFLALRRSRDRRVLPGVWQPVTGKRDHGETSLAAAVREVYEETGLRPKRWWALEELTMYIEAATDMLVALPLFAAEASARDAVVLSEEHEDSAWLPAGRAGGRYLWESQRRGLEAVRREVLRGGALARALDVTESVSDLRRRWRPLRLALRSPRRTVRR